MADEVKQIFKGGGGRSSNLELYRIIVMLLIVAHHLIVNSGVMVLMAEDPLSYRTTFAYLFGMWGKTGINCFVMITGYFMCESYISLRKWLKLLLEVMFYKIIISSIFWLASYQPFSIKNLYAAWIPITNMSNGFTSAFMVFYLFIPFLNKMVHTLSQKEHLKLIGLSLMVYVIPLFLPLMTIRLVYVTWFCIIYFIASYIRLYSKSIPHSDSVFYWKNITLGLIACGIVSSVTMVRLSSSHDVELAVKLVSDSNAILAIAIAVSSFMWFKNMKIKQSKIINTIGASTFGVLCIHANSDTMRSWLWKDTTNISALFLGDGFAIKAILIVFVIFLICIALDYLRIRFVERPLFVLLDCKFSNYSFWTKIA